jgi:lipid-binding SYLF domain-containing protein
MHGKRLIVLALGLCLIAQPSLAYGDLAQKVDNARLAYRELFQEPDKVVPSRLLDDANCIAVIPNVIKGAFGVGGRAGRGVFTCRNEEGVWSPPIFIKLWGGSVGFQFGGKATDLVLFFMTERSARALLKSRFTLGGDASIAAGPQGRSAEVGTDVTFRAEIYSYAKSRGLFAGIALDGAHMAPLQKATTDYYGERLWPDQVLFDHQVSSVPDEAKNLLAELP